MISVFIISGQSVMSKYSLQVGCRPAGVDITNIWLQQPFSSLHVDQTDRELVHSQPLIWISVCRIHWTKPVFAKTFLLSLWFLLVSVPTERLVDFSVNVQPSASPCLHLPLTTELWWRCQGRSDLRNSNCAWTPATWTPSPPPAAARQSSAPPWWRSGRRPIL